MSRTRGSRADLPAVVLDAGVHLVGSPLWFDADSPVELAFVSHGAGALPRHRRALATERTMKLLGDQIRKGQALVAPYRRPFALGDLGLELFPAGHMPGSAQLRVRTGRGDLVYAGVLNLEPTRTAERAHVVPCDVLVLDATYGHPRYAFPPRPEVEARIVAFVRAAFGAGATPVLFPNSVGTAVEVVALLGQHGFRPRVDAALYGACRTVRECGVELPAVKRFQGTPPRDEVVVFPASAIGGRAVRALRKVRTAALSGGVVDRDRRREFRTDEAFPLSSRADFPSLLRYVEVARPARVYTLGGFAQDLAEALRARGVEAAALAPPEQMELF